MGLQRQKLRLRSSAMLVVYYTEGQFYNHFKNNQELTNKNYLQKNIKKAAVQQRPNYPLTFDIESNEDKISFEETYIKFQQFRVFNMFFLHLESKNKEKFVRWRHISVLNKYSKNRKSCPPGNKCLEHLLYRV